MSTIINTEDFTEKNLQLEQQDKLVSFDVTSIFKNEPTEPNNSKGQTLHGPHINGKNIVKCERDHLCTHNILPNG